MCGAAAGGTFAAGKASLSGVLPLLNIPVLPKNSPEERVVAGFPPIVNPSPISPFQALSPPSTCMSLTACFLTYRPTKRHILSAFTSPQILDSWMSRHLGV